MGYTKIDNHFIDETMAQLSPSAVVVYLVIMRQTSGWNRESDIISLSQFSKLTGMSANTIGKAITELLETRLIIRTTKVINSIKVYEYGLSIDNNGQTNEVEGISNIDKGISEIEIPLSNIEIPLSNIDKGGISKIERGVSQKLIRQKKDIKKDKKKVDSNSDASITVDKPTSRDDRLDSWQIRAYRDIARLTPPHAVRDRMLQSIVDEAKWREAIQAWIARGYRPQNIDGMIDFYKSRYTEKEQTSGRPRPVLATTHRELIDGKWQDVSIEDYIRRHEGSDDQS